MKHSMMVPLFAFVLLTTATGHAEWVYDKDLDKMRNQTTLSASTVSLNKLKFEFPYNGGVSTLLFLRNSPQHGKEVILALERGQFSCSLNGCSVSVKFDDGKIERYRGMPSDDGNPTYLFISPYAKFVSNLKKSKRVTIEAKFFREGACQIEFDVTGLDWK